MRFRGHHLICLHFYHGEGYEEKFIANLSELVARAKAGETVEIVSGPDDVCACCPHLQHSRCHHREDSEPEIRQLDEKALNFLAVKPGQKITWPELAKRVTAAGEWLQHFCLGCDWSEVCNRVR